MTYTAALLEVIRNILGPDATVTANDGAFTVDYNDPDMPAATYSTGEILTMCAEMVREQENDAKIEASRIDLNTNNATLSWKERLAHAAARFSVAWVQAFGENPGIDVEDGLLLTSDGISRSRVYIGVADSGPGWDVCADEQAIARGLPIVDAIAAAIAHERAAR